jgi:hypothetical protein
MNSECAFLADFWRSCSYHPPILRHGAGADLVGAGQRAVVEAQAAVVDVAEIAAAFALAGVAGVGVALGVEDEIAVAGVAGFALVAVAAIDAAGALQVGEGALEAPAVDQAVVGRGAVDAHELGVELEAGGLELAAQGGGEGDAARLHDVIDDEAGLGQIGQQAAHGEGLGEEIVGACFFQMQRAGEGAQLFASGGDEALDHWQGWREVGE